EVVGGHPVFPRAPASPVFAALSLDFDHEVHAQTRIKQKIGILDAGRAEQRPLGFVDRHARHPQRTDVRLECRFVVVRSMGHPSRPRGTCRAQPERLAEISEITGNTGPRAGRRRRGNTTSAYSQSCSAVSKTCEKLQSSSYSQSRVEYSRQILGRLQ